MRERFAVKPAIDVDRSLTVAALIS